MPHLDIPIKKDFDKLLTEIKSVLASGKKVKPGLDALLPSVFNFRIKAIKWFLEEDKFDPVGLIDEAYLQIEEFKQNPKLGILAGNSLFALRCNRRVVDALIDTGDFAGKIFTDNSICPQITYEQFLVTLALNIPNDKAAQKFVDWINASLYIEITFLSVLIINDENLNVSDNIISELAFLIADAAQQYSAIANEFGILKQRSQKQPALAGILEL